MDEVLGRWRERLRGAMLADPRHHLDFALRRAFYLELGQETRLVRAFRGWLAVLCVQKVLPIILQATPSDREPLDELSACISHLLDAEMLLSLRRTLDSNYHGSWVHLQYFYPELPENALAVRMASFRAMQEVKHWDNDYGWLDPFETARMVDGRGQDLPTTDADWVGSAGVGDAASTAAVAFACSEESTVCDPEKLRAFWEWWLDEGWERALFFASELPQRLARPLSELYPSAAQEERPDGTDLPLQS